MSRHHSRRAKQKNMGRRSFEDEHPRSQDGKFAEKAFDEQVEGLNVFDEELAPEPEQAVKTLTELEDVDYRRVSANRKRFIKAQDRAAVEAYSEYLAILHYPSLMNAGSASVQAAAENVRQSIHSGNLCASETISEDEREHLIGYLCCNLVRTQGERDEIDTDTGNQNWWTAGGKIRGYTEALADTVAAGSSSTARFIVQRRLTEMLDDDASDVEFSTEAMSLRAQFI